MGTRLSPPKDAYPCESGVDPVTMTMSRSGTAPTRPADSRPSSGRPSGQRPSFTRMGGSSGVSDVNWDLKFSQGGGCDGDGVGWSPPVPQRSPVAISRGAPFSFDKIPTSGPKRSFRSFAVTERGGRDVAEPAPQMVTTWVTVDVNHGRGSPLPLSKLKESVHVLKGADRTGEGGGTPVLPDVAVSQSRTGGVSGPPSASPIAIAAHSVPIPSISIAAGEGSPVVGRTTPNATAGKAEGGITSPRRPVRPVASARVPSSMSESQTGSGSASIVSPRVNRPKPSGHFEPLSTVSVEPTGPLLTVTSLKPSEPSPKRPPARQRGAFPTELQDVRTRPNVFAQVSLPEGGVASPRPRPKLVKSLSLTDRPPTRAKPLTQCMHLDEPEISVHSMTPPGDESLVVTGTSASPVRPVVVARDPPFVRSGGWIPTEISEPAVGEAAVFVPLTQPAPSPTAARPRSAHPKSRGTQPHKQRVAVPIKQFESGLDPEFLKLFAPH